VFELASVTKQFTATAIMTLAEERNVGLDDPVAHVFAKKQWSGGAPEC
jgi:CubicO group peptidase (beta-lactamase class C family)